MNIPSNTVVLRGTIANEPTDRQLPSGVTVVQFDLRTIVTGADRSDTITVPLSWSDPTAAGRAAAVDGADVVVTGTVRRRFFRAGGQTQSRTEVVVDRLVPSRRTKSVRSLLAAVAADLTQDCG
ncbi:single-stranded DNA-binding protein [Ilumatobacter coccineus]|nr:single-stranded DNA-binding protein [Ilumatobacter coccineus]